MEAGESVHLTKDRKQWYNRIKYLEAISNATQTKKKASVISRLGYW
jgi:hypothetical protein